MSECHYEAPKATSKKSYCSGGVALLQLEGAQLWKLDRIFSGSHTDVVRSVIWDEQVRTRFPICQCDALNDIMPLAPELGRGNGGRGFLRQCLGHRI